MRKRDLFDYIILAGGLISTGFAIYFYYERYRELKMKKRSLEAKTETDKLGVILD
jgi:hypothetical protein